MKNIMKEAHNLTKKIIKKGDSYRATFRLCLSFAHAQVKKEINKMVELVGSEKQIKWANDLREGFKVYLNFCRELVSEIGITERIKEWLKWNGFESVEEAFSTLSTQNSSKKIIGTLKGIDYVKSAKKDRIKIESQVKHYKEEWIISEKESCICHAIFKLSYMK